MKDNTHYFQHDYNASEDEKVIDLRADYGWEGYGIFWKIIEMLAQHNGKMHLHCNRIAFALQVDKQKVEAIIKNYNLFEFEGEYFYSKRLLNQLNWREEIKQKRKKAAEKRWNDGSSNASALQEQSKSNAGAMQDYAQDRTGQDRTGHNNLNQLSFMESDVYSIKKPTKNKLNKWVSENGYPQEFEELYNLSFKKQDKLAALVHWVSLKESEREKVREHWPEYTRVKNDQYQKLFRTYLSERGWEMDLSQFIVKQKKFGVWG